MAEEMSKLVDQYNQPIPKSAITRLQEEEAGPDAFSARPPFVGHLADRMDPRRLGAIIRAADNGQTRDWFILAEEIEELFPHYLSVLSKRKRQVCGLPITVDPAQDVKDAEKHADFIRRWVSRGVLEESLFDVLDGLGKGFSVSEIQWESRDGGFVPAEIAWRNQRDFELSWEDGETIWLRTNAGFEELFPHKFLVHKHRLKSGSPVRSSLTRAVCWLWMYATYSMKDWALFVQGYGMPIRIGKYGPGASGTDKKTLWRAVRSIGGDLAAIIPDSMKVEFAEAKGATEGAKLYEGRMNWINAETSKLVLGGVAGTDAVAGSHAVGKDHRAAEQDVEKFDARVLAASINKRIVQTMIAFRFGPQAAYPKLVIGQQELVPISDVIAAAADLGPLGLKIRTQDVLDRLQLTKPEPGDDVIGMPEPVPGAPGAPGAAGSPLANADVKIKANPHPEINPNSDARAMMTASGVSTAQYRAARQLRQAARGSMLGRLVMHTAAPPDVMAALEERLSREAGDALAQMTAQVRACMEEADAAGEGMEGFAHRLAALELDPHDFAVAMSHGMALAHLAGQANVLDELK